MTSDDEKIKVSLSELSGFMVGLKDFNADKYSIEDLERLQNILAAEPWYKSIYKSKAAIITLSGVAAVVFLTGFFAGKKEMISDDHLKSIAIKMIERIKCKKG